MTMKILEPWKTSLNIENIEHRHVRHQWHLSTIQFAHDLHLLLWSQRFVTDLLLWTKQRISFGREKKFAMALSPDAKERLGVVFEVVKTAFHWGFIPTVLYLGNFIWIHFSFQWFFFICFKSNLKTCIFSCRIQKRSWTRTPATDCIQVIILYDHGRQSLSL